MLLIVRLIILVVSAAIGGGATYYLAAFDQGRAEAARVDSARVWTNQIIHQIDSAARMAREKGDPDPVGFAVNLLAQGIEPRQATLVKIFSDTTSIGDRIRVDLIKGQTSRWLESKRVFSSETGVGVKISIRLEEWGLLGARSKLQSDITFVACTVGAGSVAFFLLSLLTGTLGTSKSAIRKAVEEENERRNTALREWLVGAKTLLQKSGGHVRDVINDVNVIATSNAKVREGLKAIREGIHAELTLIHGRRIQAKSIESLLNEVGPKFEEARNKLSTAGESAAEGAAALEALVEVINPLCEFSQQALEERAMLEKQLEPWSMDADMAFHASVDADKAFKAMSTNLRLTVGSLMEQVQTVKNLQPDQSDVSSLTPTSKVQNDTPVLKQA